MRRVTILACLCVLSAVAGLAKAAIAPATSSETIAENAMVGPGETLERAPQPELVTPPPAPVPVPVPAAAAPAGEPAPTSANPLWAIPLSTLTATRDRPLFSASRRPPPPAVVPVAVAPPPPPPPPPTEPEKPNLILVGTVVGDANSFGEQLAVGAVAGDGTQTRIADFNRKLWSQLNLTVPEEINYSSFDGKHIQGWIQKPPDFDPQKKYPLILNIHGGPHAAYGWVFDHEFQWMAAKGYIVLYVNPRGSTSYGQEFGNIIQYHYPGDDYRDLMAGVDELLKRGYVDPKKLGVTGGSGGGVLTNWTITHTDRFAAAVSQRDISNWASWWYTADFTLFQPNWFKAPPFEDSQDYSNRSAITFVKNIHTPVLFVLGESDYRTPQDSGGEQLFRALKYMRRPTAMVVFPRETHELSRSGEPWHRIERLEHIVNWFDKWMMGVPHPEFDINPTQPAAASVP